MQPVVLGVPGESGGYFPNRLIAGRAGDRKDQRAEETLRDCDSNSLYPTRVNDAEAYAHEPNTGLITLVTDANSVATKTDYDRFGRPLLVTNGYGTGAATATSYEYSDANRYVIARSDLDGTSGSKVVSVQRYDSLGNLRLTQLLDGADPGNLDTNETAGIRTEYRHYYSGGYLYKLVSNPSGGQNDSTPQGWTQTIFDQMGRVATTTSFQGSTPGNSAWSGTSLGSVTTSYGVGTPTGGSIAGQWVTTSDEALVTRTATTDALGRLVEVVEAPTGLAYKTLYDYDVGDNLIGVYMAGQSRNFTFDSLSRLRSATNPENGTIGYTYDADGNLLTRTQGGITTTLTYDSHDRLLTKTYTDNTPTVTNTYGGCANGIGRLCSASNSVSATTYQYDPLGRATESTQTDATVPRTFQYAYNLAGSLDSVTYPSGREVTYGFDAAGRPTSAQAGTTTYASGIEYASSGGLLQITFGNGLAESWSYNSRLQPTQFSLGSGGSVWSLTNDYSYRVGNNGNVQKQVLSVPQMSGLTTVYSYDSLNRLSVAAEKPSSPASPACSGSGDVQSGGWCQQFSYDQYGNRLIANRVNTGVGIEPGGYDNSNHISSAGWQYDARGDIVTDAVGNRFGYDAEGRQIAYCAPGTRDLRWRGELAGACATRMTREGQRVRKELASGGTATYVYDSDGNLAAEYDDGLPPGDTGTEYLTTDQLGSTRTVTNASGGVVSYRDYEPFGDDVLVSSGSPRYGVPGYPANDAVSLQFTGKEKDTETNLNFFLGAILRRFAGEVHESGPDWGIDC